MLKDHLSLREIAALPVRKRQYRIARCLYLRKRHAADPGGVFFRYPDPIDRKPDSSPHWREMGLGSLKDWNYPKLLNRATELRLLVKEGRSPLLERQDRIAKARAERVAATAQAARTFRSVAALYLEAHGSGWRSTLKDTTTLLARCAYPALGALPVAVVTTEHVVGMLQPIWGSVPTAAGKLRLHTARILDFA
jgi:hypothetical protein